MGGRKLASVSAGLLTRQIAGGAHVRQPLNRRSWVGASGLSTLVEGGWRGGLPISATRDRVCSSDGATAHRLGEDGGFVGRPLLLTGGGFAASGIRGKKKQMHKVPVSGGVEGLDDDFLNSIKRRVNPNDFDPTEALPAEVGVWYGQLPIAGVERHRVGLDADTVDALNNILDFENSPSTGAALPSLEEIEAEETEEQRLKALRKAMLAQKEKRIRATRVAVRDEQGRSSAIGRRKTAVAQVTIWPGDGTITINNRAADYTLRNIDHRGWMIQPFILTNTCGLFDVKATVHGGGSSGQAQAIRHGIARALQLYEPSFRPPLKSAGMLTRDPRMVERKKPGRKKARKAFQWVKR